MWALAIGLASVTTVLAWLVAERRPEHRPIAALWTAGIVADVARQVLAVYVLHPAHILGGAAPLTGLARVAGHVEEGLFLAWPAGLSALAVWIFLRRRPWVVGPVYAVVLAALVVGYPTLRGALLARVYLAAELAAIAVWLGGAVTLLARREAPTLNTSVVLLMGAVEIVTLLPYQKGPFTYWPIAQAAYMTLYVVLIVVYGGMVWNHGSSSRFRSR